MTAAAAPSEARQLIQLAIPLAAQQLGFQLMGAVDAALLGHHRDTALAAAGLGNNLLFGITAIGLGIVLGLDSVIPRAVGAQRPDDARRYLSAGLRIAAGVGLAATLVALASPLLLELTDTDPAVAEETRRYVHTRAIGIAPFLISIAYRCYLAAHDVTRPLIVAVIVGNLANAALDLVLIFGVDAIGLPPLGVIGAAIATVTVQIAIAAIYASGARALAPPGPRPQATRAELREVLRYGVPVGGQIFAEFGIFGVATVLAAHLGTLPSASHAIALTLASFTFALAMGVGSATSVRVGHAVGAGDLARARRRGAIGIGLGLGAMGGFALAFLVIPGALAGLFTDDAVVVAATIPLLQIAALFQLSDGAQAIAAGALRGIGHTRETLIGNLLGHYTLGLPVALALTFSAGLGAAGLWWGLSAGLTGTAIFLVVCFHRVTRA